MVRYVALAAAMLVSTPALAADMTVGQMLAGGLPWGSAAAQSSAVAVETGVTVSNLSAPTAPAVESVSASSSTPAPIVESAASSTPDAAPASSGPIAPDPLTTTPVSEPGTLALIGAGLIGLAALRRRRS
jgi:hypothetical protein